MWITTRASGARTWDKPFTNKIFVVSTVSEHVRKYVDVDDFASLNAEEVSIARPWVGQESRLNRRPVANASRFPLWKEEFKRVEVDIARDMKELSLIFNNCCLKFGFPEATAPIVFFVEILGVARSKFLHEF